MFAYSERDPLYDADVSFSAHAHGSKPVYLLHRSLYSDDELPADVKTWDLTNYQVLVHSSTFARLFTVYLRAHLDNEPIEGWGWRIRSYDVR